MILYRIKRISTGKYFWGSSQRTLEYLKKWAPSQFGKTGAFYKGKETIKKHLHNLCHDWKVLKTGSAHWDYELITVGQPKWERLADLEVEIITIIDHGEKTQSARDFMGILEEVE